MKWNESLPNAVKLRFFSVIKTEIQPRSQNTPVAFGTPYREITYHASATQLRKSKIIIQHEDTKNRRHKERFFIYKLFDNTRLSSCL
jgi:hypothetical protein